MRALPASLRQAILFDMDHSQISALPEDLATEARALQQQHREREIDLFAAAAHRRGGGSGGNPYLGGRYTISANRGLGGIYNVASSLLHDSYLYSGGAGGHGRDLSRLRRGLRQLNEAEFNPLSPAILGGPSGSGGAMALEKSRNGRQLLDQESLASLLVLLFIDEPRMNMTKLHRVVRNLCIHSPTRAWVIKALLCILEKVSGKIETSSNQLAIQDGGDQSSKRSSASKQSSSTKSPGSSNVNNNSGSSVTTSTPTTIVCQPSWLTMSIDGPFGSKTNVFTIIKPIHKKSTSQSKLTPAENVTNTATTTTTTNQYSSTISINTQACPAIFKQILEILSTLARAANFNFFPRNPFPPKSSATSQASSSHHHHHHHHHNTSKSHFWDIIVKLDQSKNKSSKLSSQPIVPMSTQKLTTGGTSAATSSASSEAYGMYEFDADLDFTVENSPLARLMSMLDYPVLKNNAHLMDKMFTCLSYASAGK